MSLIVALEGTSNAHKSSTIKVLAIKLQSLGINPVLIKPEIEVPGSVPNIIRLLTHPVDVYLTPTQEVCFYSALLAHKRKLLSEYLNSDRLIILDRYHLSIIVLGHYVRKLSYDQVCNVVDFMAQGVYPDLTFILDIDYDAYQKRLLEQNRTISRKELGGEETINSYIKGYKSEASKSSSYILVDARNSTADELSNFILNRIVKKYYSMKLENKPKSICEAASITSACSKKLLSLNDDNHWPEFKWLVFDLEGTLFFSESFGKSVLDLAKECLASFRHITLENAEKILDETRDQLSKEKGFRVALTETLVSLNVDLAYWNEWQAKVDLHVNVIPDKEIRDALCKVGAKYKVVVLTNMTSSLARRTIEYIGIENNIVGLFTPDKDGFFKPSTSIYTSLSERFSILPAEILSIGDRFNVDLEPAIEFGAYGCVVTNKEHLIRLADKLLDVHEK